MAAWRQSLDAEQHRLRLSCVQVAIDFTLEHAIDKHVGKPGPPVLETDPADGRTGKSKRCLCTCIEGKHRASSAVRAVDIRVPVARFMDGAAILFDISKQCVSSSWSKATFSSSDLERINPDPVLCRPCAPAASHVDCQRVIS